MKYNPHRTHSQLHRRQHRLTLTLPFVISTLIISSCASVSAPANPVECPALPPPPVAAMEPVKVDFLKRMKNWLYESPVTQTE